MQVKNTTINKLQSWFILGLAAIFYLYQMILQISPNSLNTELLTEFAVSEHRLGLFTSAFYFSYMLMQIPVGFLLDKFGVHRMMIISCSLCSCGNILFSVTPYFFLASVSRLIMGVGAAFAFLSGLKLIINWFPKRFMTVVTGLFSALGMFGGLIGESLLSDLMVNFGWRKIMFFLSIFGLSLTCLIWKFICDTPKVKYLPVDNTHRTFIDGLQQVVQNKQIFLVAIFLGLLSTSPMLLASLYGIPFLSIKYNIKIDSAGSVIAFIFVGIMVGNIFWGWVSDYNKRRLPPMIFSAIFSPLLLFILVNHSFPLKYLSFLLFFLGMTYSGAIPVFSIAREISKPELNGIALGLVNAFDCLGITILLPLFGRFLDIFGHVNSLGNQYVYTLMDYTKVFNIVIFIVVIPLMLIPFIKETYAK